jgi:hypothetical protein
MIGLPVPPVPDLARLDGTSFDEVVSQLLTYYEIKGVPWNYVPGTRIVKCSYKGMHDIKLLLTGCSKETNDVGRKSNEDIVRLAAPNAFDRSTQVFDLPRRQFHFGRDLNAGYRIPFFFVENRIVKLFFLQPRKSFNLTYDQLCMVATIHKRFLLDMEFYGQAADVEYVDLSADPVSKVREMHCYSLNTLELWTEQRLADRLSLIAEAIEFVRLSGLARPRPRRSRPVCADMPLFD